MREREDERDVLRIALSGIWDRVEAGDYAEVLQALRVAVKAAEVLAGPAPVTACRSHPFGAVDPEALDGCFICEHRRRRAWQEGGRPILRVAAGTVDDLPAAAFTDPDARARLDAAQRGGRHAERVEGRVVAFPDRRVHEPDHAALV